MCVCVWARPTRYEHTHTPRIHVLFFFELRSWVDVKLQRHHSVFETCNSDRTWCENDDSHHFWINYAYINRALMYSYEHCLQQCVLRLLLSSAFNKDKTQFYSSGLYKGTRLQTTGAATHPRPWKSTLENQHQKFWWRPVSLVDSAGFKRLDLSPNLFFFFLVTFLSRNMDSERFPDGWSGNFQFIVYFSYTNDPPPQTLLLQWINSPLTV